MFMTIQTTSCLHKYNKLLGGNMNFLRFTVLALAFITLTGCATSKNSQVNRDVVKNEKQDQNLPKKFILLPIDMTVSEISAGGIVEEVPDWSMTAKSHVDTALAKFYQEEVNMELLPTPELTNSERELVEEHVALYDVSVGTALALKYRGGSAWKEKNERFNYTLGSGLSFLKQKTDADAALIVIGLDQISSAERKAAIVAAALFGVGIPGGISFISAGVVDINTGDIVWFNHNFAVANRDLREKEDAVEMTYEMLAEYPVAKTIKAKLEAADKVTEEEF